MEEHVIVDSSFSAPINAPLEKSLPIGFTSNILARAWSISELRVAKAALGTSTRLVRRRWQSQSCRFGPASSRHPISSAFNATVPFFRFACNLSLEIPAVQIVSKR
jgi:hypothetical protein